jgi:hypothetical protein
MLFGAPLCRKLAEREVLKFPIAQESVPGLSVTHEGGLIEDVRIRGFSSLHLVGCRMRRAGALSGVRGLRVAVALIMRQVVGRQ